MDISFMTGLRRFILFISCLISSQISAQAGLAGVELQIHHVQGQVYMIQRPGGGGNIGALIGEDGVFLVDSLFAPMSEELVNTIREVTDGDIRFVINTHIHIDHVGGNQNLVDLGAIIFSHENTRSKFLEDKSHFPRNGGSFAPQQPESARPMITFNDSMTFHLNGEEVSAFLVPPHTQMAIFSCIFLNLMCCIWVMFFAPLVIRS